LRRQHLHHDSRRRKSEASAEDDRGLRLDAGKRGQRGNRRRAHDHLQAAETEHEAAHGLNPLVGQFEPDGEQEKDNAKLRDAREAPRIRYCDPGQKPGLAPQGAKAERTKDRARAEIAENGAEAEAPQDGDHDPGGAKDDERVAIDVGVVEG
jgi:hypothetical protein